MNTIKALLCWLYVAVIRVAFAFIGLFVVPFAIPRFTFAGEWQLLRLSWWALPWDNERDGILGDSRLHYWNRGDQFPAWMEGKPYLKAWYWTAWRNPTNWLTRQGVGCDLTKNKIITISRGDGWWFNRCGDWWYGFDVVKFGYHFFIGFKLLPKYRSRDWSGDPSKAIKGFSVRLRKAEELYP